MYDRRELSWQTYRFDYFRWHANENIHHFPLENVVFIWETEDKQIAAVQNPESRNEGFLQVHPNFRSPELTEKMMTIADERLAIPGENGERKIKEIIHIQPTHCAGIPTPPRDLFWSR